MKRPLILLVVVVVITTLLCLFGCGESCEWSPNMANEAKRVCREFVKRQLVAPATAQFSDEEVVSHLKDETFFGVKGAVDSQNAFGAQLRQRYLCMVEYQPHSGEWRLVSLDWSK